MQYRPTQEELLMAIADFIEQDVRPQLEDRGLAFRCLIAANLARMCVLERRMEEWHDDRELDGLCAVLEGAPDVAPAGKDARRDLLEGLNARLAGAIKDGSLDEDRLAAAQAHLRRTLQGRLAITNPRFDADSGWKVTP